MNEFFPIPSCRVEQITHVGLNHLHIAVRGTKPGGCCPNCGRASRVVHSRYQRRPADLPSRGRRVRIGLRVRRFYCRNLTCVRRTFAERLPELVKPHARRTDRLAEAQSQVGLVLGSEAGAQLLSQLAMPASADTVLRLIRDVPLPEPEPPHAVAVDDWAEWPKVPRIARGMATEGMRKGRIYGTIVVDLERRRVVDLLPDRTAETLADWLRRKPGIEIVPSAGIPSAAPPEP